MSSAWPIEQLAMSTSFLCLGWPIRGVVDFSAASHEQASWHLCVCVSGSNLLSHSASYLKHAAKIYSSERQSKEELICTAEVCLGCEEKDKICQVFDCYILTKSY